MPTVRFVERRVKIDDGFAENTRESCRVARERPNNCTRVRFEQRPLELGFVLGVALGELAGGVKWRGR